MNRKLRKDISASSTQVIVNQSLGLVIFFITSRYLDKSSYGELNWSLAVLTFITSVLSLRLEHIVVKRIAAGKGASQLLTFFTGHVVFTGVAFYLLLLVANLVFPAFFSQHNLLLVLAISHLLSFFSSPFKQLAAGQQEFGFLAIMSTVSNLCRLILLVATLITGILTIQHLLVIYIISSFAELVICFYISHYKLRTILSPEHKLADYFQLIRDSLPLAATVILNVTIARIDWILVGLFSGVVTTAEYSFAYKVFELSPLPLLVVAPLLLSRLSAFFATANEETLLSHEQDLSRLIRIEMVFATVIPLVLNLAWSPLMDAITGNKYGAVNETTFLMLSCCIPFLYLNNLLWSVEFAQERLKRILRVTFVTFCIILVGDSIFIPLFGGNGAAAVYLVATIIEFLNYLRSSVFRRASGTWRSMVYSVSGAAAAGAIAVIATDSILYRLSIGLPLYCLVLLATKQLRKSDWIYMLRLKKSGL